MIWASAQAGNRAGKTGCQQQWWDKGSEWKAVASTMWKLPHSTPFAFPRESWSYRDLPWHFAAPLQRLYTAEIPLLGIEMFSCFENIHWQVELFTCSKPAFAHDFFRWALPVAMIWGDGGQWNLECPAYHVDGLPQPSCWSARVSLCKQRSPGS